MNQPAAKHALSRYRIRNEALSAGSHLPILDLLSQSLRGCGSLQLLPAAIFPYLCLWLSRYPVIPGIQFFSIDKAMDCLAMDISGGELQLERHRNCLVEMQFIQQLPPENRSLALSVGKASMRKKYDWPWHVKVCFRQIQKSRCRRNGHPNNSCRCWLLPVSRFLQEVAKVR